MDMISSLLSKPPSVKVLFENDREKTIFKNLKGELVEYSVYYDKDSIKGKIIIELNKNKNFEHSGIKVELIGEIINYKDKRLTSRFIALTKEVEPPGQLNNEITTIPFDFSNVEMQYETYKGKYISVRYYLQTTMNSKYKGIVHEAEFVIFKLVKYSEFTKENKPQKMEVGIEDWIHVSFEIDKMKYFLRSIIEGQVVFKKVSVRLESMELQIIKRETLGSGVNSFIDNEVLAKYELMDGAPINSKIFLILDENIPIRLFLQAYNNLSSTYNNVNNKFSVQYFLTLVLIDLEDRRYFKQMEINLCRLEK